MVVGEPSLMGGEFGEEDERLISRLENSQYDPAAAAAQAAANVVGPPPGPPGGPLGPHGMGGPPLMDDFGGPPPPGWVGPPVSGGPPLGPPPVGGGGPGPGGNGIKMEHLDTKKSPKNC